MSRQENFISQTNQEGVLNEQEQKEKIFQETIYNRLRANLIKEMEQVGLAREEIQQFLDSLVLDSRDIDRTNNILALPWSLRQKCLQDYLSGERHGRHLWQMYLEKYALISEMQAGVEPIIGFHTSGQDIDIRTRPDRHGKGEVKDWSVSGTENSDIANYPTAYASDNYHGIYRYKDGKYLYLVRITDTTKKFVSKTGDNWYFAASFPIVARFELKSIDEEIEREIGEEKKKALEDKEIINSTAA